MTLWTVRKSLVLYSFRCAPYSLEIHGLIPFQFVLNSLRLSVHFFLQMVSQEMLLDITGESARRLALLTYHRLLQASVKQLAS